MYDSHNYIKKKNKTTSILAVPDELTGQVAQPHNCGRQHLGSQHTPPYPLSLSRPLDRPVPLWQSLRQDPPVEG